MSVDYILNNTTLTFNNLRYVDTVNGNDTTGNGSSSAPYKTMAKAIGLSVSGDGIFLKGVTAEELVLTGKNISIIGNYRLYGSRINGKCHGSSANYPVVKFYDIYLYGAGPTNGSWSEQFYYISPELYNCIHQDLSSYTNVYGTYKYYNCLILALAQPYSATTFTNCAFASPVRTTTITCMGGATYDANYKLTNASGWKDVGTGTDLDGSVADIGLYGGAFTWGPPPSAPTYLHTDALNYLTIGDTLTLTWDNGTFATDYELQVSTDGGQNWSVLASGLTTNSYQDTPILLCNYIYRIRSHNVDGYSTTFTVSPIIGVVQNEDLDSVATMRPAIILDSQVTIRRTESDDVDSSVQSYHEDSLESTLNIRVQANEDLDSTIDVKIRLNDDLDSTAFVRPNLDMVSNSLIQFINTLDVNYLIQAMETANELDSFINIVNFYDLLSNAMIRAIGNNSLDSTAKIHHFLDVFSTAFRPYNVDLDSYVSISDLNILDIIYKLIQAPILTQTCNVIQDAYIREARDTLNYGTSPYLLLGNPLEGHYEFVMQLDTTPYNNLTDAVVLSADLVLHLSSVFDTNLVIDVYSVTDTWNESTITWSNFNPTLSSPIRSFTCSSSNVKLNILDILNDLKSNGQNNISLLFKVSASNDQLFYFDSKETSTQSNAPHIEIKYQSASWTGYTDNADLNANAQIRILNARDLHSTFISRRTDPTDLTSDVTVRLTDNLDLPTDTTIRRSDQLDLESLLSVHPDTDLDGTAILRRNEFLDLDSNSNLFIANDIDSLVDIKTFFSWMDASAIIRRQESLDLDSIIDIRNNFDVDASAIVRRTSYKDLDSRLNVRLTDKLDLDSIIDIKQVADEESSVTVRRDAYYDKDSLASIRHTDNEDVDSTIFVRGSIFDLISTSSIRRTSENDTDSNVEISYGSSLDSTVTVHSLIVQTYDDFQSSVIIRHSDLLDLESTMQISKFIDLDNTGLIRQTKYSDLESLVLAQSVLGLDSTATIRQMMDVLSSVIVRHTAFTDLDVNAIFRQFDISELSSIAYTLGIHVSDLNGKLTIRRFATEYLYSIAEIRTTARQWIPNVHGRDIFNYQNRKLPRVWKRENFIP